jgi:hypothetical protein
VENRSGRQNHQAGEGGLTEFSLPPIRRIRPDQTNTLSWLLLMVFAIGSDSCFIAGRCAAV